MTGSTDAALDARSARTLSGVGWVAAILGLASAGAAAWTGWSFQDVGRSGALEEVGGYALFGLPGGILATVILAVIAGARGGRGRALGIVAGVLAVATLPLCFAVATIG